MTFKDAKEMYDVLGSPAERVTVKSRAAIAEDRSKTPPASEALGVLEDAAQRLRNQFGNPDSELYRTDEVECLMTGDFVLDMFAALEAVKGELVNLQLNDESFTNLLSLCDKATAGRAPTLVELVERYDSLESQLTAAQAEIEELKCRHPETLCVPCGCEVERCRNHEAIRMLLVLENDGLRQRVAELEKRGEGEA